MQPPESSDRPFSLDNIWGRRLTEEEVVWLQDKISQNQALMSMIANGYPEEESEAFGKCFLDEARNFIPDLGLAHAADALARIVIEVRGLRSNR